jgi:hypothetical protein
MTCRDTKLPEKVGQGSAVAILSRELFLIRFSLTSASRDFRLVPPRSASFRLVSASLTCCAPRPKMRLFRFVPMHRGFRLEGP